MLQSVTYLSHTLNRTSHGEHTLVHALYDLTDPCLDSCLLAELSNIFASFANDDTSVLGADE